MNKETISRIIKRIEGKKCIVILGPQLLYENGSNLTAQLASFLIDRFGEQVKYYADDEMLKMSRKVRLQIEDEINEFYDQLKPSEVYSVLADIPFPMIINTGPDTLLNKAFQEKGLGFDYDYYRKYEAPKDISRKNRTFIYNLFGDYSDINSMVLTFDDLFDYLFSIMGDNELNIKSDLRNATSVLFFGFSFDKWYFKLLLRLLQVNDNKLLHSNDISQENIKNFYTEEFEVEFFGNNTAAEIISEIHLQAKEAGLVREQEMVSQSELFVSYAWGGESEEIVGKLNETLRKNQILLVWDKRDLGFKGLITEFMDRIGKGKGIVVVVSDKYLRSPYCMYELLEIYRNREFTERIFPIVMSDATIFEPIPRLAYLKYWRDKKEELDSAIRNFGADAITVIGEDYKIYKRVFDNFGEVVGILKDINSLSPEMHQSTDFEALVAAIKSNIQN
jgi:hypothetical protein